MSGFGTKKYGADLAQQLTYPEVFAAAVRDSGKNPYGFFDNVLHLGGEAPPAGNDLQAAWHQQKLADANHMALAKVAATKRAVDELWAKHKAPVVKPVLAQRKIANPSNGNMVDIYAARKEMSGGGHCECESSSSDEDEELQGGVLRTEEGQKYGHKLMMNRVGQLNAIDLGKQAFAAQMPVPATSTDKTIQPNKYPGVADEVLAKLQRLLKALQGTKDPSVFQASFIQNLNNLAESIKDDVLLRLGEYSKDDYNKVFYDVGKISTLIYRANEDRIEQLMENRDEGDDDEINESEWNDINGLFNDLVGLGQDFAKYLGVPPEQRVAVVRELAKKYGLKASEVPRPGPQPSEENVPPPPVIQPGQAQPSTAVGRGGKKLTTLAKTLAGAKGGKRFSPVAFNGSARFDRDGRTAFGNQSGAYLGESLGQRVAVQNVPVPIELDGTYVNPITGYTRPVFPKMPIDKKPSNSLKPIQGPPPPVFQDSAKGIFSAPRMRMPAVKPVVPKAFSGAGKPVCPHCKKAVNHRKPCPKAP